MSDTPKKFAIQITDERGDKTYLPSARWDGGHHGVAMFAKHSDASKAAVRMSFATAGRERYEVVEVEG